MKKRFKTVVTTAMVAALTASLLTGCGSSTNDTTASAPETGKHPIRQKLPVDQTEIPIPF